VRGTSRADVLGVLVGLPAADGHAPRHGRLAIRRPRVLHAVDRAVGRDQDRIPRLPGVLRGRRCGPSFWSVAMTASLVPSGSSDARSGSHWWCMRARSTAAPVRSTIFPSRTTIVGVIELSIRSPRAMTLGGVPAVAGEIRRAGFLLKSVDSQRNRNTLLTARGELANHGFLRSGKTGPEGPLQRLNRRRDPGPHLPSGPDRLHLVPTATGAPASGAAATASCSPSYGDRRRLRGRVCAISQTRCAARVTSGGGSDAAHVRFRAACVARSATAACAWSLPSRGRRSSIELSGIGVSPRMCTWPARPPMLLAVWEWEHRRVRIRPLRECLSCSILPEVCHLRLAASSPA
jgi:hypothetical protein